MTKQVRTMDIVYVYQDFTYNTYQLLFYFILYYIILFYFKSIFVLHVVLCLLCILYFSLFNHRLSVLLVLYCTNVYYATVFIWQLSCLMICVSVTIKLSWVELYRGIETKSPDTVSVVGSMLFDNILDEQDEPFMSCLVVYNLSFRRTVVYTVGCCCRWIPRPL